ncbi:MAG: DUF3552 domain-containing protein, partial [Sporichthyaceae bacterium]|nr:DUF3552 domain-containing protein [Sporichthyaceae bacterium]
MPDIGAGDLLALVAVLLVGGPLLTYHVFRARAAAGRIASTAEEAAAAAEEITVARREIAELRDQAEAASAEARRQADVDIAEARSRAQVDAGLARDRVEHDLEEARHRVEVEAASIRTARAESEAELRALREDIRDRRVDLERRELRLADREQRIDADAVAMADRAAALADERADIDRSRQELADVAVERQRVLEQAAGLTADAAKGELVTTIATQAKREAALLVRDIEAGARQDGEQRARAVITGAIQRLASEQTAESVVSVVHLPGDEMKGRIIGREGRNIRAFESVTGVNLIIDDTPEAVLLSSFDPI